MHISPPERSRRRRERKAPAEANGEASFRQGARRRPDFKHPSQRPSRQLAGRLTFPNPQQNRLDRLDPLGFAHGEPVEQPPIQPVTLHPITHSPLAPPTPRKFTKSGLIALIHFDSPESSPRRIPTRRPFTHSPTHPEPVERVIPLPSLSVPSVFSAVKFPHPNPTPFALIALITRTLNPHDPTPPGAFPTTSSIDFYFDHFDLLNARRVGAPWIVAERSLHGGRSLKFGASHPSSLQAPHPKNTRIALIYYDSKPTTPHPLTSSLCVICVLCGRFTQPKPTLLL